MRHKKIGLLKTGFDLSETKVNIDFHIGIDDIRIKDDYI